ERLAGLGGRGHDVPLARGEVEVGELTCVPLVELAVEALHGRDDALHRLLAAGLHVGGDGAAVLLLRALRGAGHALIVSRRVSTANISTSKSSTSKTGVQAFDEGRHICAPRCSCSAPRSARSAGARCCRTSSPTRPRPADGACSWRRPRHPCSRSVPSWR